MPTKFNPNEYLSEPFNPNQYLQEVDIEGFMEVEPGDEVEQVQRVPFTVRAGLKNLIGNSPTLQEEYLQRKGFETRVVDGEVQLRKPGEAKWGVVDPEGLDLQDVTDVIGDFIDIVAGGLGATAGGAVAGPLGVPAGAGIAAGAVETGRQTLARGLGFREEFEPGEIGIQAGVGTVAGALGGVGEATLRALPRLGREAAIRTLGVPTTTLRREGREKVVEQIGRTAQKEGLVGPTVTTRKALEKVSKRAEKVGQELSKAYDKLDKVMGTKTSKGDLVDTLTTPLKADEFADPRLEKSLRSELNNLLSNKEELSPSEMWKLSRKLDERARTFTRSTAPVDASKADLLQGAASQIRTQLKDMARTRDIPELATNSELYHRLKLIENSLDDKITSSLGVSRVLGKESLRGKAMQALGEVIEGSMSKTGRIVEPALEKSIMGYKVIPKGIGPGTTRGISTPVLDLIRPRQDSSTKE